VSLLNNEMPADIVSPLRMKFAMYLAFLVLVLISAGMEVRQMLVKERIEQTPQPFAPYLALQYFIH
jgi:hypothetical protein